MEDILAALDTAAVLLIGESHDDRTAHHLEEELLRRAHRHFAVRRTTVLSLEMIERDVQVVVDEYLSGLITGEHFRQSARLGSLFADRYGPQVAYAKEHGLPVVAANAPRRYANLVSREGISALHGLSKTAQSWLAPLPYPDPSQAYQDKWLGVMKHMDSADVHTPHEPAAESDRAVARGLAISNMLRAQVLWDATMAHAIAGVLTEHEAPLVLHVVGSFHISGGTGLPEQLRHYAPSAAFVTLLIRQSAEPASFFDESLRGTADFVIQTREAHVH